MNCKQNQRINQVKESTLVVGIDIGSTTHYARVLTGAALNLGKSLNSATAGKVLKTSKAGCSGYRTKTKSQRQ